jgi:site-specific recombinase XerD
LIKACKDLAVAQEQLGHADIRTTMKYSDMTLERKRKAVEDLAY